MTSTTPIITIATTVPIIREDTFFLSADRKNVFSLRRRVAAAAAVAGAVMGTVMGTEQGTVMRK